MPDFSDAAFDQISAASWPTYTPGDLNHVFFTTGGSTAVDSALRFIQFYNNFHGRPKKKHIITREYAYHGSTYLSASVSGKPGDRGNLDFVTETVHHLPAPNTYRRPDGMSEAEFCDLKVADLENKIKELGPENVACFIAEPLMATSRAASSSRPRAISALHLGGLPQIRCDVHLRRSRHRLRPAGRDLRLRTRLRHRSRHHHLGQGPDLRLCAARRVLRFR